MNYKKFSLFSITGLFVLFIMVFATLLVPFKDLKAVAEETDKTFKGYSQNMSAEEIHSKTRLPEWSTRRGIHDINV